MRVGEQDHAVFGIQVVHDEEQGRRQSQQHDAGQPTFTGQGLNLSPDLESFANQRADLVEDFGQVTTRLPLQDDGGDEEPQVEVGHAIAHVFQRFFQRHAQVLRFVAAVEFLADRIGHFFGHQVDAAGQAVSGPQRPADQFQGFGHLLAELLAVVVVCAERPRPAAGRRARVPAIGAKEIGNLRQHDGRPRHPGRPARHTAG